MKDNRIKKLQKNIGEIELGGLLISQLENIRYLCCFTGSAGWLLVSPDSVYLFIDSRYTEQAKFEVTDKNIVIQQLSGNIYNQILQSARDINITVLGFESNSTTFAAYQQLNSDSKELEIRLVPYKDLVESQRAIKDQEEIDFIKKAADLADQLYSYAVSIIKPGVSEQYIAWEMEKHLREHGSESIPFEFIIASGQNAAMPHASPSEKLIKANEPIVMDIGARYKGYCSDLSRTIYLGQYDETFRKIYDIVLAAQLNAIAGILTGISGQKADAMAREIIAESGYGKYFGHGLGHGLGLMVHESPRLGPMSTDTIEEGMVFTIEPGIYLPGWGGIRIEDTVVLEKGKVRLLTNSSKMLNI